MPEQVPFIDRENELALIDNLIREWGTLRFLCINAAGGIGKTRLLQEVRDRYLGSDQGRLIVTEIIDFDDRTFHTPDNVARQMSRMFDQETIKPYMNWLLDYRKMEIANITSDRLLQAYIEGTAIFIECFNKVAVQRRIVLFFDTIDALTGTDVWGFLVTVGSQFKNCLILIAGRNVRDIGKSLQSNLSEEVVQIIDLLPLEEKGGKEYLQQKQRLLRIELEPELVENLLFLSGGNPILIDLAVEWRARGISLAWLMENNVKKITSLSKDEMRVQQKEFEQQLVNHLAQTRTQMDNMILLMSHIYPLDIEVITTLLDMTEEQAKELFVEAKTYVFIKILPDGRITLHDEMRRMINDYVWPEVDPEEYRKRRDSKLVVNYLENKIQGMFKQIAQLEQEEKIAAEKGEIEAELLAFSKREALERETWVIKAEHLRHNLLVDISQGIRTFSNTFDEATRKHQFSFREVLLTQMQQYSDRLTPKQLYELNSRRVKSSFDFSHYPEAKELATNILNNAEITPQQRVDMLISKANTEIRLGHVKIGISDFEEAVKVSEENTLSIWHIRALNGLGWAYRLIGDFGSARRCYHEARLLCLEEGGQDKEDLKNDYGWISNNLAFVYSDNNKTRETAIDIAQSMLEHWRVIGDNVGLGAAYIVLGIAYYRGLFSELALDAFQKALNIFEPLKHNDWLSQVYSWRGALYQDMGRLEDAEKDLKISLAIGSSHIEAMTLSRLGRVYIAQGRWDLAEEYTKKSYECARNAPNYIYWLVSIARLTTIATEKEEYHRLDEFSQMLQNYFDEVKNPEKHPLGFAYMGMAQLALGQNDETKIEIIVDLLRKGISLVTEYGSYARTDVRRLLTLIEKQFSTIKPQIIHSVGKTLKEYFTMKEEEDISYSIVTPIIHRWIIWKGEGTNNE